MTDVIKKLVDDLKLRFRRRQGPKRKETDKWGAADIPFIAPLLLSLAYLLFSMVGVNHLATATGQLLWLFGPFGIILFTIIVFTARSRMNRHFLLKAYEKLLVSNERFTLYEYCKYLKRRIAEAEKDPSLGGPAEVARLQELINKLLKHLREGPAPAAGGGGISGSLSEETLVAESILEAYDLAKADPLHDLDSRLPEAIREEIELFDKEEGQVNTTSGLE